VGVEPATNAVQSDSEHATVKSHGGNRPGGNFQKGKNPKNNTDPNPTTNPNPKPTFEKVHSERN